MKGIDTLVDADCSHVSRRAYFDEEIFAKEQKRVFRRAWQFVAHESEVVNHGDYVTRRLGSDPVIVVRAANGDVNVLHNSCKHRGSQICPADFGKSTMFRCGYHGWVYNNAGELRAVPGERELYGKTLDRSKLSLTRAPHVEIFCGLIFATWDPDALPLKETLGAWAWYMEAVFGKCEMEVVGPPTRILSHHNWKSGAENWAGDGYHGLVSHKLVFDFGMVTFDLAAWEAQIAAGGSTAAADAEIAKRAECQIVSDKGGHAGFMVRQPFRFNPPAFLGYEPHLWPEFTARLSTQQAEMASGRMFLVGTMFPNFSFQDGIVTGMGDDSPPVATLTMRLWLPISATETELVSWVLVPKAASADWKRLSKKGFARSLGVGGLFEVDDFQNWTGTAWAGAAPVGMAQDHDFTGCIDAQPSAEIDWPGHVYPGNYTDVMFRAMFSEWARMMEVAPSTTSQRRSSVATSGVVAA